MRFHQIATLLFFSLTLFFKTAFAQPSPANDDFLYAQKLFNESYHDLCLAQLEAFRERYPDAQELAEVWKLDGEANMALRRFVAAETAYRTFEIRYPFHQSIEEVRLRLAESQKLQGRLEHAALTLQRFVALHPRSARAPLALYQASALWQQLGESQKARTNLYALIEDYPQSMQRLPAHLLLVQSFNAAREYERALQEAERTLRSFPESQLNAQAFFLQGRLQEQVGHYQLAEQNYLELLKKFSKDELVSATYARLAELQFARGDLAATFASLDLAAQTAPAAMKNRLALRAAEMRLRVGQTSEAAPALQKYEAASGDSVTNLVYLHLLGNLHEQEGKREEAAAAYQRAVQLSLATERASDSTSATPQYRRQRSLWRVAQLHFDVHQYEAALQSCRRYRREYPQGKFRDALLYLEGRVQQVGSNNLTTAQRLFDELLRDFPQSVFVDEAQFALAETYEAAHELRLAQLQWQRFLQLYPASPLAEAAQNKLQLLAETSTTDSPNALAQLSETMLQANEKASREEFLVALARLNYERRNHRTAQRYAKMAMESATATAAAREAAYLLGASFYQLAERARWQGAGANALQDSARLALQSLSGGERDALNAKAEVVLARLWVTQDTPRAANMLARADSLLALNEETPDMDFLRVWTARARKNLSAPNDSAASNRIINALAKVTADIESPSRNEALYELADWQWQRGDTANAMRSLETMRASKVNNVFIAKAQLRQAHWLAQQKQHEAALVVLQRMKEEYFYCAFADSASAQMTRLYIAMGKFKEALSSMNDASAETRSDDLTRARLLETTGEYAQTVQAYLRFLAQHPEAPEVASALLEAAR
ncbi:MAG: outer membrane protein assembly factor BamD, partial [candidate division KSB1 bacterium]